ncbi:glycosyltransferase [Vibrio sp. MA40-2]|uniref:glycosyltransferase n=1 Tax=Vibrio sp. MA40-2 TaxID=3391828 RepID=UPI0039A5B26F
MKNINLLVRSLNAGGAEGVAVKLANELSNNGNNKVNLITLLGERNQTLGSKVADSVSIIFFRKKRAAYTLFSLTKLLVSSKQDDIFISFNYETTMMLNVINKLLFKKVKVISRNINTISKNLDLSRTSFISKFVYFCFNKIYFDSDIIVNQCNAMQEDMISLFPFHQNKMRVIYNPVIFDYNDFSKQNEFDKYILYVGRLERQKSVHRLIEIFSKLNDKSINLVIAGDGSMKQSLIELTEKLGLSSRIFFLGVTSDVAKLYYNAQLTALTSLYEGFPNVLIESISYGTPVVSFDCPSGPAEIINSDNGLLVKNNDVIHFLDCVELLLNNQEDRETIRQSIADFSISNIAFIYNNLIEEM